ncbi:MAG: hypothetical protein KBH41_12525 [Azonexus sp.]|nr:hypothetical protein [Azonexus sp.]
MENTAIAASPLDIPVMHWVIFVGGYGAFVFEGNEFKAEEMRKHKARSERAVALKRPADASEAAEGKASQCLNHTNFTHHKKGIRYACDCCA